MSKKNKKESSGHIAKNKKARHYYELLENLEAGIELRGTEVKSLRAGLVAFRDSYVQFKSGEAWLVGLHIAPYENAGYAQHDPDRDRKLLLHRRQIAAWAAKVDQRGFSVVPVAIYFKDSRVKVEIALGRGKKLHDQRDSIKERDIQRDVARQLAGM
ncbi:SsrA-binding protein SmpB [Desulfovibrio mangrovi]|uniref:SsrA-binding protein SmpB n=1 Tax=Desulfovibrio mangrovi TaxID=2976983 RepID=UPI0022479082|nr:SsrA-binding protein SmpB [Desulfovibrio mangrovi]UZP67214.1 SsrA-binding protein SmpB [Desulfovibrio mangrovi]